MMRVPSDEVDAYLLWSSKELDRLYTLGGDCRMSSKIYDGELCSFTTIQPGKNRDDYWCNDDMCHHLIEVAMIGKWVHRSHSPQPELVFIFDGSSNHGARAMNALHMGGGINRERRWEKCSWVQRHDTKPARFAENEERLVHTSGNTRIDRTGNASEGPGDRQSAMLRFLQCRRNYP